MPESFEYRHIVGFEETNLVGNVYYANHLRWQGRCREMFLRQHCPGTLDALAAGLALVTTRCSCEYFAELLPFDEVIVRMQLEDMVQNRVTMGFKYIRMAGDKEELVARGEQQIACMERRGDETVPVPVPEEMRAALALYSNRR